MKKPYKKPELTIHGNIENLTQMLGEASTEDTLVWAGEPIVRSNKAQTAAGGSFDFQPSKDLNLNSG